MLKPASSEDWGDGALARSLAAAGYGVHYSHGIWWHDAGRFFAKPVDPLLVVERGAAYPSPIRSLLGYSHVVAPSAAANHSRPVMLLGSEKLIAFELKALRKGRKSSIKQALKGLDFEEIVDLESDLDAMNKICISQADRTGHGRPPKYYTSHRKKWARFMRREFAIPSRLWLGAYKDARLVGYCYAYQINGTMYISAAKSHTDALGLRPNDGMLFTLLERCRSDSRCEQVIFGDWSPDNPSLNAFKESYGFSRSDLPIYRHARMPMRCGLWMKAAMTRRQS